MGEHEVAQTLKLKTKTRNKCLENFYFQEVLCTDISIMRFLINSTTERQDKNNNTWRILDLVF